MPSLIPSRALECFGALVSGSMQGYPSKALAVTAERFGVTRTELAGWIRNARNA